MGKALTILVNDQATFRSCGTCNLCCITHGIAEIAKPRAVRCGNLNTLGRCGCYATRPESCRTYRCLWLRGHLQEEMKPIRSRAVMDMNETGDMLVMHVLKEDRRNIEHGILRKFIDKVSPQVPIIVVCGDERIIYGARDKEIKIIEHNIKDGVVVVEEHSHTQR